ncbi:MAG: 4Fe-4S dicluster domain-containing protein, partial [Chloroflexota bacterium]
MNLGVSMEPARYAIPANCGECAGPCIDVCPTAAVLREPDLSIVIAPMKCSGCQLCIVACPLGILFFDPGNKIARMM